MCIKAGLLMLGTKQGLAKAPAPSDSRSGRVTLATAAAANATILLLHANSHADAIPTFIQKSSHALPFRYFQESTKHTNSLVVSRGKTYRYQKFLCTTGLQICQAGLRYTLVYPAWHCLCVRAPTPRFRAAAPTCGGIYHRASHAALPGFPAPPHNRLRAPQSCRHCQPCACDVR